MKEDFLKMFQSFSMSNRLEISRPERICETLEALVHFPSRFLINYVDTFCTDAIYNRLERTRKLHKVKFKRKNYL